MTAKQFFKSTAFKCIAVLLSIILVCGILLTVFNSLFYVTPQEKFDRAIKKIYGKSVQTEELVITDEMTTKFSSSYVSEAYKVIDDGNYLIKSTGKQGFGGDVTCWVVVRMDGDTVAGAGNIAIDKASGESYVSKIDSSELAQFSKIEYSEGFEYELGYDKKGQNGKDYIATGASYTMRAISNAVNGAIEFVNVNILGSEAKVNPYEGLPHSELIDQSTPAPAVSGTVVTYNVTTISNGRAQPFTLTIKVDAVATVATVTEFKIETNGSTSDNYKNKMAAVEENITGKNLTEIEAYLALNDGTADDVINTGATKSNVLCYEAAAFALANYSHFVTGGDAQ